MRGRRRVLFFFFLTQIQTVTGNYGSVVGSCPCDSNLPAILDSTYLEILKSNLRDYENCPKYIRFRLPRKAVCASYQTPWAQELRTCFDNHECGFARTYQSANQGTKDDYPTTTIQNPTGLDQSPLFTTTQASESTRSQSGGTRNRNLSDTTGVTPENSSLANLKRKAEKEQMVQQGTSAIIPILSLLGIVFLLTGVLVYVFCQKQVESPKWNPKGFDLIILPKTDPPDSLI